ncbi:MAG TPA: DUF222 domain-containing protein, partial [Nocardioides sp.]
PDPTEDSTAAADSLVPTTDSADSADSAVLGSLPGVGRHPVLACVDAVRSALKDTAGVDPVFMTTPEKAEALLGLTRLADQVAALRLQVEAVADDVAETDASRDVAAWLAHHTRSDPAPARADLRLAHALYGPDPTWPQVGTALAQGRVSLAQARVITHALDRLPTDLDQATGDPDGDTASDVEDRSVRTRAEAHLVEQAADFAPRDLRVLGRRVLDVVAPEVAEAEEARQLAAEEAHARAHTSLRLRALGDGTTHLAARLPDATAARLSTYLHAYTSPRHTGDRAEAVSTTSTATGTTGVLAGSTTDAAASGAAERIPYDRQLGHAFCALLEHLDPDRLPLHGGDATTVMVTMTLDQLTHQLTTHQLVADDLVAGESLARADGVAHVSDGTPITAGEARRLACTARLIPAVLGGESQPLDLGRSRRLFTPAQRKALRLRDRHCRADGCTVPATWCEAHHTTPWTHGGNTDLVDGILLCTHHHHRAHDPAYAADRLPNGDLRYHRRT